MRGPGRLELMRRKGGNPFTAARVEVVAVPQLFPTPPAVARRMIELAGDLDGLRVLEPSAGLGNIITAIRESDFAPAEIVAVEINHWAASRIPGCHCDDFLTLGAAELGTFDRVLMNPPFANGADITHVLHAQSLLRPRGFIVAVVANGPRQQRTLRPLASHWEELPAGTFYGTGVHAAICVLGYHA